MARYDSPIDYSTKKVLLIESSGNMRSTMVYMLRTMGVQNIKAITINSRVFIEMEEVQYDVILLGHSNSETVSGAQILEEARFRGIIKPTVAWLFMTGDASQEVILQAIDSQPDAVITMPFSVDELKRRLDQILSQKARYRPMQKAMEKEEWEAALLIAERDFKKTDIQHAERVAIFKARALAALNQHHEAVEILDDVYWNKQDREVALTWAEISMEVEQYDVARDLLLDLIQRNPLMISAYDRLAEVYERTGDLEAAVDVLMEATAKAPLGIPRQMKLGHVATRNRRYEIAGSAYQKSIVLGRRSCYRSAEPFLRLANIRRLEMKSLKGRERKAMIEVINQLLTLAQSKFPRDHNLRVQAALLKAEVAKVDENAREAAKWREEAELFNSELEYPLDLERERLNVMGDQVPMLDRAPQQKPVDAMLQATRDPEMSDKVNRQGIKQYLAGKLVHAIKLFTLAVDYDPQNTRALLNLSQLFLEAARDEALNRDERLKMADYYLQQTEAMKLNDEERQRAEVLSDYQAHGVDQMPGGSLETLLR
ncbi:MAG: histidine kinase [Marinobacterium sp.]|nr:histidine kinase [Marinobacterium sp.]